MAAGPGPIMRFPFKNLVFKGGGVLGVAYAGAVEVLALEGILPQIERLAGTSAGAIASLLLALRYDAHSLTKVMMDLDFKRFTSKADPLRFQEKYGWYSTQPVREWLESQVRGARAIGELSGKETFAELRDLGCRGLHVFATNLNRRCIEEFSVRTTPEARVVDAVLASLSIPAFFQSFQFPDDGPTGHIYVDGGAVLNYPIAAFDLPGKGNSHRNRANPETLGFHLELPVAESPTSDLGFGTFSRWAEHLYEAVKDLQSSVLLDYPEHFERTVFVDSGEISPIDFEITTEEKQWLVESGRRATEAYLRMYRYRNSLRSRVFRAFTRVARGRL